MCSASSPRSYRWAWSRITGTEGTLIVPDPNAFTGEVKITRAVELAAIGQDPEWEIVPVTGALAGRGMGVLDMARSIRADTRHLASGELGYHVLDTLVSIDEAIESRSTVEVASTVEPYRSCRGMGPVPAPLLEADGAIGVVSRTRRRRAGGATRPRRLPWRRWNTHGLAVVAVTTTARCGVRQRDRMVLAVVLPQSW